MRVTLREGEEAVEALSGEVLARGPGRVSLPRGRVFIIRPKAFEPKT